MDQQALVCQVSLNSLNWALFGHFFNSLICDPRVVRMGDHIRFPAWSGLATDLIIYPMDCLPHLGVREMVSELGQVILIASGGKMDVPHEGRNVTVYLPRWEELFNEFRLHRQYGLGYDKSREDLAAFLVLISREAGQAALELVPHGIPDFHGPHWEAFKERIKLFLPEFERRSVAQQLMCSQLIHKFAASRLVLITCNELEITNARTLLANRVGPDVESIRAVLDERDARNMLLAEELQLVMQMYWTYHYEKSVMPGAEHDPILRLLPRTLARRIPPPPRRQPAAEPPLEQEGPLAEAPALPVLAPIPPEQLETAVAGLVEVMPGDPILNHPRIQFYFSLGAKKVYRTKFFGRDDYLAIPIKAASGKILIALVSLQEGHTADYFLEAGRPGDPPEILLAWTGPAQWTRKRLRQERPPLYKGKVRHYKAHRPPRVNPAPARPRRQPVIDEGIRWHNEARRLLAAN